jgi:hypothetical protein
MVDIMNELKKANALRVAFEARKSFTQSGP